MRQFLSAVFLLVACALPALAQNSSIPPEEFNNTSRLSGDSINVCFDRTSLGLAFDQDVARAIGDALFLRVEAIEGFGGFPLNGDALLDAWIFASAGNLVHSVWIGGRKVVAEGRHVARDEIRARFGKVMRELCR